ncbi:MAG: translocation and assembly module lipoprotein TamL [Bacteroidales bacterium]
MKGIRYSIPLWLALLILQACSNTKFLADNELLYTGREKSEIIAEEEGMKTSEVKATVNAHTDHKVNNGIMRKRLLPPFGLWIKNYWKSDRPEDQKGWIYRNLSADPVLISDVNPDLRAQVIENQLFDLGYFEAKAWATIDTSARNPKKATIRYHVEVAPPYSYHEIRYDSAKGKVDSLISSSFAQEKIRPGDQFNLSGLKSLRNRLARGLQDEGYYYFIPDYIDLKADTTGYDKELDLIVSRNREVPSAVLTPYTIDNIMVRLSKTAVQDSLNADTLHMDHLTIISDGDYLKYELLRRGIYLEHGKIYTRQAYEQTLTYLNNLGVFSYVRISFAQPDSTLPQLDVNIDLLMADNIHLDFEGDLVTKSSGYAGPALMIGVNHGNAFGGAEKIHVGLEGSLDWQWGRKSENQLGTLSYEAGINSGITVPKLLLPEAWKNNKPMFLRQTSVNVDLKLLNRVAYYQMFSVMTNLNYRWGNTQKIQHSFSPAYLNQISLLRTTPEFDSVVNENIYIRKSFEEQFILGLRYSFTYDDSYRVRPNNFFFQGSVNTSGNLVDAFNQLGKGSTERPYVLLSKVYSQYMKFVTDARYYRNWEGQSLAVRLYAGIGIPYLNSAVLPYVEQFFSGGAYSIRGFTARYLGPGSFHEERRGYIDQSGDLKLEANLEYRFSFSNILKGALFLETGNIWLTNEDENRPGSGFNPGTFYNELAVGTGAGLRFDFNFFILRTDFGFPLRNPYPTDGRNWLFGTRSIWKDMHFYLAIGYPF